MIHCTLYCMLYDPKALNVTIFIVGCGGGGGGIVLVAVVVIAFVL